MVSKKVILTFKKEVVDKPIVCELTKEFDLTFNILEAKILPRREGVLIMELIGEEEKLQKGLDYLIQNNVIVEFVEQKIKRDEEKCYHCGICISVCPPEALVIDDKKTMKVSFYPDRCIACGWCVKVCPVKAMSL